MKCEGSSGRARAHLEIEIEVVNIGDAPVHDGPWECIPVVGSVWMIRWEKAGVVTLATDDDSKLRVIRPLGRDLLEGRLQPGQFFPDHGTIFAL